MSHVNIYEMRKRGRHAYAMGGRNPLLVIAIDFSKRFRNLPSRNRSPAILRILSARDAFQSVIIARKVLSDAHYLSQLNFERDLNP